MEEQSTENLSRYLLGQMTEAEQTEIEVKFLGDEKLYQELLIAEEELRFSYARGLLSPHERVQFERRFLTFPDEQQKLDLARAMVGELTRMEVDDTSESIQRNRGRNPLAYLLNFRTPQFAFAMTAVLLIAVGTVVWLAFERSRLRDQVTQLEIKNAEQVRQNSLRDENLRRELEEERNQRAMLEQEVAQPPTSQPPGRNAATPILSLVLSPGRVRGDGATSKLSIPSSGAVVVLMLKLEEGTKHRNYHAEILNSEGTLIWSRNGLPGGRSLVVLRIPSRNLAEDDYEINLKGMTQSGELERAGDYYFTVLKK